MNDKELADKIVALGVGELSTIDGTLSTEAVYLINSFMLTAERFVTDWRVAGALIEKIKGSVQIVYQHGMAACAVTLLDDKDHFVSSKAARHLLIPRAIIEACVEALSKKG